MAAIIAAAVVPDAALAAPRRAAQPSAAALAEELRQAREQMARMQARLDAMEARLNAAATTQTGPQTAPQTAASEPAAAQAQQAAILAQADAAKAQAEAAKAQADTNATAARLALVEKATAWAANTSISGKMYLNATAITQHTAGGGNANTGLGLNLKRAYLTVDHRFSKTVYAQITMDAANVFGQPNMQNPSTANLAVVGKGFFIKRAYLEARVSPALTLRVGSADTPWVTYAESNYQFRHYELTITDRIGYANTADWGIHATGELYRDSKASLGYGLSVVNGAGYRQLRITGSVDVAGRISSSYGPFYAGVGGHIGKRGTDVQSTNGTPTTYRVARRLSAIGGYRDARFGVGTEYFYAKNWNDLTFNPTAYALSEDAASGWSFFGDVHLAPRWVAFARYDTLRPNELTVPALRDHYGNIGLQFSPIPQIDVALIYKREVVRHGALTTANGVIGCSTTATANAFTTAGQADAICAGNGTYDEVGLFSQIRF